MRDVLKIEELIKQPLFGINKVRKITIEEIREAVFVGYDFIRGGRVLRAKILRRSPVIETVNVTQFVELPVDKENEELELFIQAVKDGEYLDHGRLKEDDFKEAYLEFYIEILNKKLSYGENPELVRVIPGRVTDTVYFRTTKDGVVKNHTALWRRLDIDAELNSVVVVPRPLYYTYRQFIKIVAGLVGIDESRLEAKGDPLSAVDYVNVGFNEGELTYRGTFRVSLPATGEKGAIYGKDLGVVPVDPVDPEPETPAEVPEPGNPEGGNDVTPPSGTDESEGGDNPTLEDNG